MIAAVCIIIFLVGCLGFAIFYLLRFARIIMVFEDDLTETVEALQSAEVTIGDFLKMQMFYDSPEVQREVTGALQSVQATKVTVAGLIRKFAQRSKRRYEYVQVVNEESEN